MQGMNNVQVPLNLKLWRTVGCHELLASLGFDLIGVGKDEVMLRSGKTNSRRAVQCTVQALCALTGKYISNPRLKQENIHMHLSVRTTLCSIINGTTGKYCSVAFI